MGTSLGLIFHVRVPHAILDLVIASQCKMGLISIINAKVFLWFHESCNYSFTTPRRCQAYPFSACCAPMHNLGSGSHHRRMAPSFSLASWANEDYPSLELRTASGLSCHLLRDLSTHHMYMSYFSSSFSQTQSYCHLNNCCEHHHTDPRIHVLTVKFGNQYSW